MKTIGTCKECKFWDGETDDISARCGELEGYIGQPIMTDADFGCVNWESRLQSPSVNPHRGSDFNEFMAGNYPTRTAQDLEIADLKRENNAAFQRIEELSEALFNLGYDPTAKENET